MINLFFDDSPLSSGHAVRGVGSYTRSLLDEFRKNNDINLVDSSGRADVVHIPYFDLFFNTFRVSDRPTVVTIYDVIPLIYPKHYPSGIKGKVNFFMQKRKLKFIDRIITISETSKKDIVRFLDVPSEKIYVTYLASSPEFNKMADGKWKVEIKKKYGLPDKFVLYVGDVNYNKNLNNLASTCKKVGIHLVVVGKQLTSTDFDANHTENKSLVEFLKSYGEDSLIIRLGFVPTNDLVKIYNLASLYCQPSLYEGFGLNILDAMTCGVAVAASKIQVFTELYQDCVSYFDPYDVNNMTDNISKLLNNKNVSNLFAEKGINWSRQFSWRKTSKETIDVYKSLF